MADEAKAKVKAESVANHAAAGVQDDVRRQIQSLVGKPGMTIDKITAIKRFAAICPEAFENAENASLLAKMAGTAII